MAIEQVKIVQILVAPEDSTYQGSILGLGDDGVVYVCPKGYAYWIVYIPEKRSVASRPECGCSPSFRTEVERIANVYIPDNDGQAPLALSEMREALQSLLANHPVQRSAPC